MVSTRPPLAAGMAVFDETEQSVGQIQEVSEETILVRVYQDIAVPLEAVTDNRLVLPLHIDLGETTTKSPADETGSASDPYTRNVPDPSIFLS